jgi:Fic family protein
MTSPLSESTPATAETMQWLPLPFDIETRKVLRKAIEAKQRLAELKGVVRTIPNEQILINTLVLQEAKDSSAVENIITTHDDLFRGSLFPEQALTGGTKEVLNYADALHTGYDFVKQNGILTANAICEIQAVLEGNSAGFRRVAGTTLKNDATGETVYVPPQDHDTIIALMRNLEQYINTTDDNDLNPLVKMAVIHHQFETIHPFYDGNGRTGRIINTLFLTMNGLLDLPVLYLSRYIIRNKPEYYRLLQDVRIRNDIPIWEEWVSFMLEGVAQTAVQTIALIEEIQRLMGEYKQNIRTEHPRMYSKDLLDCLFKHPYTKVEHLVNDLQIHPNTAHTYLTKLTEDGLLQKFRIGKFNYYVNAPLFSLFVDQS